MDKSLDELIKEKAPRFGNKTKALRGAIQKRSATLYDKRGRGSFRFGEGGARGGFKAGNAGDGVSVHIGNLPFSADWKALKNHITAAGHDVSRVDLALRQDGSSRGFATATFETARAARAAIATLNDTDFEGRLLKVQEKKEGGGDFAKGGGRGDGRGGGGGRFDKGAGRGGAQTVEEPDDGYTYSGSTGRNGWVKPDASKWVDTGPPPDPSAGRDNGLMR